MNDWGKGLCARLGKKMVELTGDYTPDLRALLSADIIICTPEKWDGISRNWQNRTYVQKVCLLVIDEIHLLGADRSEAHLPTHAKFALVMSARHGSLIAASKDEQSFAVYAMVLETTPGLAQYACLIATLLSQLRHIELCLSGAWSSR